MSTESELGLITTRPINSVYPSPENDKVYNPSDITALAEDILKRGQIEPIVTTVDGYILSGHRRHAACLRAGLKTVKVRVHDIMHNDVEFVPTLVAFNEQRIKTVDELLREQVVKSDPKESYRALTEYRKNQCREIYDNEVIELRDCSERSAITKAKWPLLNAVLDTIYKLKEYWPLSVRQIHYDLLNVMPLCHASKPGSKYSNTKKCYDNQLVDITTRGRLCGHIPWEAIDDETRPCVSSWGYNDVGVFVKTKLDGFLKGYYRNLVRSQPYHIEIIGEKNTIHSVVRNVAMEYTIGYTIGRGYCSLSPRKKLVDRFRKSGKEKLVLICLSDFDPDGQEISHSFARSLRDDFGVNNILPIQAALTKSQVIELNLPPIMKAKEGSSNYARFVEKNDGDDVSELEAISPEKLTELLKEAIDSVLDISLYNGEIDKEKDDAARLEDIRIQANRFLGSISLN